jgi:Big-like domain-containing protein
VKPDGIIQPDDVENLGQSYEAYPATRGTVELEVAVSDNTGIRSVVFERWDAVNSQLIELGTDSSAPYQASVAVDTLNMEWNEIRAVAEDTAGNLTYLSLLILRLNPTITLDITEGPGDTKVTMQGGGWLAGDIVSIQFGESGNEVTQATVGDDGSFTATFAIPADAAFGEQKVIAITTNGFWQTEATFIVTEPNKAPLPETTSYGAIAYSVSLKQSFFTTSDTQEGAEEGAWNLCVEAGKQAGTQFQDDCQSAVWVANGYMSIARDFSSTDPNA